MSNKNTFYFNHDCNARDDDKIVAVRMKQGAEGYGIYFMLLELLGCSEGCALRRDYNGLAWQLRVPTEAVKRVIEDYGLFQFSEDGKLFHSARLKAQMDAMSETRAKRSQAGKRGMESRWKTPPDNQALNNGVITNVTTLDNIKEKKEKKDNITTPPIIPPNGVDGGGGLRDFFKEISEDEKYLTDTACVTGMTIEWLRAMIPLFRTQCEATETRHGNLRDVKRHFLNYVNKKKQINEQSSSYGTKETDRSNATKRVCHRPEEYGEEI